MSKRFRGAVAALSIFMVGACPALADWEGTTWGMSPQEALASLDGATSHAPSPAEIYEETGARYAPLVKKAHTIEGVAGQLSLLFDDAEALHFVLFNPDDLGNCDALGLALTERYGEADELAAGSFVISDWLADGDAIKLTNAGSASICNLSFSEG